MLSALSVSANLAASKSKLEKSLSDSVRAETLRQLGMDYYYERGDLDSSILYLKQAVVLAGKVKPQYLFSKSLANLGLMYREKGVYDDAMKNYISALSIAEKLKDTSLMSTAIMGIGVVHHIQGDYRQARIYYDKHYVLNVAAKNSQALSSYYNNMGLLYFHQNIFEKALYYYQKSLDICTQNNDVRGYATANENMGLIYSTNLGKYDKSIRYFQNSLEIWRREGDVNSQAITLTYMGNALLQDGKISQAIDSSTLALRLAERIGSISAQRDAYEILYKAYEKTGDEKKALKAYKGFAQLKDSLFNREKTKDITSMFVRFEARQKHVKDSLDLVMKTSILLKKTEMQAEHDRYIRNGLFIGLGLLIIVLGAIIFAYREKQKANVLIDLQKKEVMERNREITDSINYAKHIQESFLPDESTFHELGIKGFVFYKPKDIVAGDFYWMETLKGEKKNDPVLKLKNQLSSPLLFAVADCTGHGVPGALVSVVCHSAIRQVIREDKLTDPAKILDRVNELVKGSFANKKGNVTDGMDIAFCKLDKTNLKLEFAGANSPVYIVRNSDRTLRELKADKQPIGKFHQEKKYSLHNVALEKGDMIYLFSDGFRDQFGGLSAKKYKLNRFKELLVKISGFDVHKQKEMISHEFHTWKSSMEQVDDVCIMGIRV